MTGDGVEVSVLREYDTLDGDAVAAAWDAFERNGGFAGDGDEEDAAAAEEALAPEPPPRSGPRYPCCSRCPRMEAALSATGCAGGR